MSTQAQIYAWTVIAVGVFIATCAGISWRPEDPTATLVCLVLAMLASTFKIKLPGVTGTISPSFVFILVAAGQLSCAETVFIGAGAALVQSLWRPRVQPTRVQTAFNCGTLAIASGLACPRTATTPVATASEPERNVAQPSASEDSSTSGACAESPAFFMHSRAVHNRVAATSKLSACSFAINSAS